MFLQLDTPALNTEHISEVLYIQFILSISHPQTSRYQISTEHLLTFEHVYNWCTSHLVVSASVS